MIKSTKRFVNVKSPINQAIIATFEYKHIATREKILTLWLAGCDLTQISIATGCKSISTKESFAIANYL